MNADFRAGERSNDDRMTCGEEFIFGGKVLAFECGKCHHCAPSFRPEMLTNDMAERYGFDWGFNGLCRKLVRQVMGRVLAMRQLSATIEKIEASTGNF